MNIILTIQNDLYIKKRFFYCLVKKQITFHWMMTMIILAGNAWT